MPHPFRSALAALLLAAAPTALAEEAPEAEAGPAPRRAYHLTPGADGVDCNLRVGPRDLVVQDRDLVVPAGAVVDVAMAVRGSVRVGRGARVQKAVAAGGSVIVEDGGLVEGEAVALSGDVRVEGGGRVRGKALALGGQVHVLRRGQVQGDVLSLSLELGGFSLAQSILDALVEKGPCKVEVDRSAGLGPRDR